MSPSKKPIKPKIPKRRGMSKRNLELLGRLQSRDLGQEKALERLWELKYEGRFVRLVNSFLGNFPVFRGPSVYAKFNKSFLAGLLSKEKEIGAKKIDELIWLALKCPENTVRSVTITVLRDMKPVRFVPFFEEALSDPYQWIRYIAVNSLCNLRSVKSVPLIERLALREPDIGVHSRAISALVELRSFRSIPLLEGVAKNDSNPIVRSHAADALEAIKKMRRSK